MIDFIRKTLSYQHCGNEIILNPDAGSSTTNKHVYTSTKSSKFTQLNFYSETATFRKVGGLYPLIDDHHPRVPKEFNF